MSSEIEDICYRTASNGDRAVVIKFVNPPTREQFWDILGGFKRHLEDELGPCVAENTHQDPREELSVRVYPKDGIPIAGYVVKVADENRIVMHEKLKLPPRYRSTEILHEYFSEMTRSLSDI